MKSRSWPLLLLLALALAGCREDKKAAAAPQKPAAVDVLHHGAERQNLPDRSPPPYTNARLGAVGGGFADQPRWLF